MSEALQAQHYKKAKISYNCNKFFYLYQNEVTIFNKSKNSDLMLKLILSYVDSMWNYMNPGKS